MQDPSSDKLGITISDASVILVRNMEREPRLCSRRKLAGKRVLDLGAGCGLVSMYFVQQGVHVTFIDLVSEPWQDTQRGSAAWGGCGVRYSHAGVITKSISPALCRSASGF